ncbi:hypothetical protein CR513_19929, partial [Mucuna pruriens]
MSTIITITPSSSSSSFIATQNKYHRARKKKKKEKSSQIIYQLRRDYLSLGEMCLIVKNSFTEANESVPPSELASFNLDDIGCLVHCLFLFCAQATEVPRNLSYCIISKHDCCEDG